MAERGYNNYNWSVDEIEILSTRLTTQKNNLVEKSKQLVKLKEEIDTTWMGVAARQFSRRMAEDIELIDKISTRLDKQINDLKTVNDNCYKSFESTIKTKVHSLSGNIK